MAKALIVLLSVAVSVAGMIALVLTVEGHEGKGIVNPRMLY